MLFPTYSHSLMHCYEAHSALLHFQFISPILQYNTPGDFNAWPAGHMWPAELFAVARRPFWKNNYKH
jgi:hypothetical protein